MLAGKFKINWKGADKIVR